MFGVLLVSSRDEVLFASGDAAFREHLYERLDREVFFKCSTLPDSASTSSGFCTESDCSPTASFDRAAPLNEQPQLSDLAGIAHIFMPIISTYRSSLDGEDGEMEYISTGSVDVGFRKLGSGALLIAITQTYGERERNFIDYFSIGLRIHVGPLLELINTELSAVVAGRRWADDTIDRFCRGEKLTRNGFLDCRRAATHVAQLPRINAIVKSISDQLAIFIGSNRCFLMRGRQIITTTNSTASGKPLWRQLVLEDLNAVFDAAQPMEAAVRSEIKQYWIHSTSSRLPHYVDVIRHALAPGLELFCVSEARSSSLIRAVTTLLDALEELSPTSEALCEQIDRINKQVDVTCKQLSEVVAGRFTPPTTPFMRNPPKTCDYFRKLWSRLSETLGDDGSTQAATAAPSRHPRLLRAFHSTLSMLSISTFGSQLLHSHSTSGHASNSQFNALRGYMRKQTLNLLQEACADVQRESSRFKLSLFHDSMKRIFRQRQEDQLAREGMDAAWANVAVGSLFAPSDLRLAMYAYSIRTERRLEFSHVPELYSSLMESAPPLFGTDAHFAELAGVDGERLFLVKARLRLAPPPRRSRMTALLKGGEKARGEEVVCTALFSSYVHRSLAEAQMRKLLDATCPVLERCAEYFN